MDEPDVEDDEEYSLTESMIILKGECDLYCDADENGIRSELVNLFKTKLPFITNGDFDFVRRDRNIISSPVVKKEHVWGFKHVKHLCGAGRSYVRLNVSKDTLVENEGHQLLLQVQVCLRSVLRLDLVVYMLLVALVMSLRSLRTLHQMLALVLFVVMTTRMN